jgi:hypothetical protein
MMQFELPYRGMFWRSLQQRSVSLHHLTSKRQVNFTVQQPQHQGIWLELQEIDIVLFEALGNRLAGLLNVPKKQYIEALQGKRA